MACKYTSVVLGLLGIQEAQPDLYFNVSKKKKKKAPTLILTS